MTIEENDVVSISDSAEKAKFILNHLLQTDFLSVLPDSALLCYDYHRIQICLSIAHDYMVKLEQCVQKVS